MGIKSFFADVAEVQRNLSQLMATNTLEEEAASLEIAQSASRFSRRASRVVDDKLSFSATLMRAGEVNAATRLLAEVEQEVRDEEVALIETVNEVRVAQAVRRGRITRLRLARSLAVAMLGACVLAFSAVGMAVAGVFEEREQAAKRPLARLRTAANDVAEDRTSNGVSPAVRRLLRRLQIGNVKLVLTASEYRRLTELTGGNVDEAGLTDVIGMLSGSLAKKVEQAIAVASETAGTTTSSLGIETTTITKKAARAKKKAARSAQQPSSNENQEPSQEPAQEEEEREPSPSPSPSEREKEGDSSGEEKEGSGELGDLPLDSV